MSHTCRTASTFSPLEESFHYKAVKMHEAIYNTQGRFHISENKADTRDLFLPYNLLKTVGNASAFYVTRKCAISDGNKIGYLSFNIRFRHAFIRLFLFHLTARTIFIKETIFLPGQPACESRKKNEKKNRTSRRAVQWRMYNWQCHCLRRWLTCLGYIVHSDICLRIKWQRYSSCIDKGKCLSIEKK